LAPDYTMFLVLRALFGIGMGGEWGSAPRSAMEKVPPRWRGVLSGFLQEGYCDSVILLAAPAATSSCYPRWGWRPMFFIGGLPALLALFVRFRVKESEVWEKKKRRAGSHLGRGIVAQWRLFLYLVLLMTAMVGVAHGTQDMYPTFLKVRARLLAADGGQDRGDLQRRGADRRDRLWLVLRPLRPPLRA
jgi:SHS family lactate transporter-like MFS transporter